MVMEIFPHVLFILMVTACILAAGAYWEWGVGGGGGLRVFVFRWTR